MKEIAFFLILSVLSSGLARAESVLLTPAKVRELVLRSNQSLLEEERKLEDAKSNVALARTNLFPSLNATALLSGNFALTAVDFLLPFLVPSKWATLSQSDSLFEVEKLSYRALALNTYGSALALYFNVRADSQTALQFERQAQDLRQIADYIHKDLEYGLAVADDETSALANAENAEGLALRSKAAVLKEIAAIRQALGLPLEAEIQFSDQAVDATVSVPEVEAAILPADIEKAVQRALDNAPEKLQIDHLVKASQTQSWNALFGWINAVTLSPASPHSPFSDLQTKGSFSLGLSIFPEIALSHRNLQEIKDRYQDLRQETTQVLEGGIRSVQLAKSELDHFTNAETALQASYASVLKLYRMGLATIYDVLTAHKALTSAANNRIQAELEVTLLRVSLHRMMLTDQFSQIRGCDAKLPQGKKSTGLTELKGWWDGIFGKGSETNGSIFELCRAEDTSH